MKVYLAGGMRTEWREQVKVAIPGNEYFDPSKHGLTDPALYTVWDLSHINMCEVLFGYMAADNPSGIGLALEIGFAKGLGRTTILVNESDSKYMPIVEHTADWHASDLATGIAILEKLRKPGDYVLEDDIDDRTR